MISALIIFPNQLFMSHAGLEQSPEQVEILEDTLFFKDAQYPVNFHFQKLVFHRASMKAYAQKLQQLGFQTHYRDWNPTILENTFERYRGREVTTMDPVDFSLQRRLERFAKNYSVRLNLLDSQLFFNNSQENRHYRKNKKRWFMADFYKYQRTSRQIMLENNKPLGGKWSFDEDNRKKIPKKDRVSIPEVTPPGENHWTKEARIYVQQCFPNASGRKSIAYYPVTHEEAERWLALFLQQRFRQFGTYEDALVPGQSWLYHSVLTPMLNTGLLTPQYVIASALEYADKNAIPINSVEGFIRQIIGWREFMRATYEDLGVIMRTGNQWQHHRSIPRSFYDGNTGIEPIDDVIQRVLETGYCHHIERLMLLGGFMFLCEFEPKQIYQWFMSMFVDAYDWVMVPNVFSMSQNADGGLITTKPYFSGSAYLRKMGYDHTGDWCAIWDGLYWRWIDKHSDSLGKNPRWAMMCSMARKMDADKMTQHKLRATQYLSSQAHS